MILNCIFINDTPIKPTLKRFLLLCLLASFHHQWVWAQSDTNFWFAAPDLQQNHGDRPIFLRIAANNIAATVRISIPASPSFSPIEVNINANSSQSVDLTSNINLIENSEINTISNKGILVESSASISCYYDIANNLNGDMYALKGANALGNKFTLPFQQAFSSEGPPAYTCTFSIVATEDNTSVTIIPKKDLQGYPKNIPFTITLNKGQTYTCAGASVLANERPGGTVVTSTKPIAISTKDDSINYPGNGCLDTAGDQLIPDCIAGNEFVVIKGYFFGLNPDYYYVFAIDDGTDVKVNNTLVATLNAGEYYTGLLSDPSAYIKSSKAAHIFQVTGFGCEVGGAVIPSMRTNGSSSVSVTRATVQDFFVNILAPSAIIGNFSFNNSPSIIQASNFMDVPGTAGAWKVARIAVPLSVLAAGGNAQIVNGLGKFHMGIIHGDQGSTTRFGYFSDFGKTVIELSNFNNLNCPGSLVTIQALSEGGINYTWTGPNGYQSNTPNLNIPNFGAANVGDYTLKVYGNLCNFSERTIRLDLADKPSPNFSFTQSCAGIPINFTNTSTLSNAGPITWAWNFGDGTPESTTNSANHTYPNAGNYEITLTAKPISCAALATSVRIPIAISAAAPGITYPIILTKPDQSVTLQARPLGTFFTWVPSTGLSNPFSANPVFQHNETISYTVTIENTTGCVTVDRVVVRVLRKMDFEVPTAFTPNGDGHNDLLDIFAVGITKLSYFRVFNRWGHMLYETTELTRLWDGTNRGIQLGPDTFVWTAEGIGVDGSIIRKRGQTVLIR
jgi:gliding motility-associated-like protein